MFLIFWNPKIAIQDSRFPYNKQNSTERIQNHEKETRNYTRMAQKNEFNHLHNSKKSTKLCASLSPYGGSPGTSLGFLLRILWQVNDAGYFAFAYNLQLWGVSTLQDLVQIVTGY